MKKNQINTKHNNHVRIIGGTCRGRKLSFPSAEGLRPTPDSVRERLFNWLGQDLTGLAVLDLFGGSGALGLEAASRNAKEVVIADNCRTTAEILRQNARTLGLQQVQTVFSDGLLYLKQTSKRFDVVFLDPPFAWQGWGELLALLPPLLNENAVVYMEADALPDVPDDFVLHREGKAGMSKFALFNYTQVTEHNRI